MPSRNWYLRIQDILQAIIEIQQFTAGMSFEDLQTDKKTILAVLYNFALIGEAARNIPTEIQSRHPQIPWRLMGDMRNVMIHEYFQVNIKRVWSTIDQDLSVLVEPLRQVLEREEQCR